MPSTYSSNLKIELMSTGENSGTWGNITNTNLGTALEQAIVGYGAVSYASDANLTISITNSNAAQAARALVLNVTSAVSLTATRELVVPTSEKQYIVQNNTTGSQSITVKTSAGTGITVPNGRKAHLYVDGTNVIQMFDFVDINGGTIDGTPIGGSSAAAGAFTTLNASGATTLDGNVTLGNASGDNITFTGTITSHLLFTDNTYDIGANGATRPRNLFLAGNATVGGNLSVGGTLTLTGGVNLNGNVTVGDSSSDTLTINSTITSNLIFTDNTYDIGASGATRPRNLFLAGNATLGGNITVGGNVVVDGTTDSTSTTTGSLQTDGGLGVAKAAYIGTTLNIGGLTSGRVAYVTTSGRVTDSANLLYSGTDLTVYGITVGRGAGAVSTNTAVGASALAANTTGSSNAAFGNNALLDNTSGAQLTALGQAALQSNTSGVDNTGVGFRALQLNTTGNYNTAVGRQALLSNTTASNNTAVGYQAGYSNTTGRESVYIGKGAGYAVTTANSNTFVGRDAGVAVTTGGANTLVGETAGASLTTGTRNTFVGGGEYTVTLGSGGLVTTGSKNTILGAYNGNQGGLDIRTASNYIVLSDGDGNPREYINNTGMAVFTVDRTSSTSAVALVLSDNVTGAQTNGVYKAIQSLSNAGSSKSEIRFIETDGTNNNTAIAFATAHTAGGISEKMRVLNTGAILALSGATLNSSGTGIGFPTTQSASSDPNVLDDYEEGDWTPTFSSDGGTTGTTTVTNRWGRYVKIGRQVTVNFGWTGSLSGFTGTLNISSLPFSVVTESTYQFGGGFECTSSTATGSDGSNFVFFAFSNSLYPRFTTGQTAGYLFNGSSQINGLTGIQGTMTYNTTT